VSDSNKIIVHAMIINKVIREQHQKKENRSPPLIRGNLHPHNQNAFKLIKFLDAQLNKYGAASSCSSDFQTLPTLSNLTKQYLFEDTILGHEFDSEKTNLSKESKCETQYRRYMGAITSALDHHVYNQPATTGDHVPIIIYEQNNIFYLYIALLNVQDDITIDENTGEILDTTTLNSSTFKIALKVVLNDMYDHYDNLEINDLEEPNLQTNETSNEQNKNIINYVFWVQKGKEQIPQYIQNFIPVKYKIDDAKTTKNLMLTLRGYLGTSPFSNNDRDAIDKLVYNLLADKAEQKLAVNITTDIDPIINTIAEQREIDLSSNSFKDYRLNNGFKDDEVGNVFFPDRTTVKGLGQLKFDIKVEGNEPIKISGMRSHAGHTIDLNDDDPTNPYVQIKVEPRDVPAIKQLLSQGKVNESEESED
jgi:nucleoid-associated protein